MPKGDPTLASRDHTALPVAACRGAPGGRAQRWRLPAAQPIPSRPARERQIVWRWATRVDAIVSRPSGGASVPQTGERVSCGRSQPAQGCRQPPPRTRGRRGRRARGVVPFDGALRARYGKTNGTSFAGMVTGPNKLMRRIGKRDLITWDAAAGGYRVDPADAEVILANWDSPGSAPLPPVLPEANLKEEDRYSVGLARGRVRGGWRCQDHEAFMRPDSDATVDNRSHSSGCCRLAACASLTSRRGRSGSMPRAQPRPDRGCGLCGFRRQGWTSRSRTWPGRQASGSRRCTADSPPARI